MYSAHSRKEQGEVITVAYGISGQAKLLEYDLKRLVTRGGVLTAFTLGTILRVDDGVLRQMLFLLCLSMTVAIMMCREPKNKATVFWGRALPPM